MARSTKLERLITDPLNTRLTTVENKVTTVETRSLVDEGDNVSVLVNDAGYQNATQVDTKIQAVVGAAPAALDTLKEIADALADDEDAIAALTTVNTTQNTNIAALQTENATQATSISQLQTKSHDAVTLNPVTKGLTLAGQELALKLDPSANNLLAESTSGLLVDLNTVKNSLNPTRTLCPRYLYIYINNSTGSDLSSDPESNDTPFKTITRALKWANAKFTFYREEINVELVLMSNYQFTEEDLPLIDGLLYPGIFGIKLSSIDNDQKEINDFSDAGIVFQNIFYNLTFQNITFPIANSSLIIQNVKNIDVTGLTIFLNDLKVKNCGSFFNSNGGLLFDRDVVFDSLENAELYTNGSTVDCVINKSFTVKNVINTTLKGSLNTSQSLISMSNVLYCIFGNVNVAETAINYSLDVPLISLNNVESIQTSSNFKLNSTSGLIKRPLLRATNCANFFGGINFENTYTATIVNQAVKPLLEFINSVIKVGTGIKFGSFSPCFSTSDPAKKLISLIRSSYPTGTAEATIKSSVYNTSGRAIDFDKYSDYLGENLLDLRGKIRRLTLTTDITLSVSDASKQHLINQTAGDRNVGLPSSPVDSQEFEIINHSTSTYNLVVAGETVTPGNRHAVQWDGVEWVVM